MIEFVKPTMEQLSFRQQMLSDEETMAFNRKWGGTVAFPRENWAGWYDRWMLQTEKQRFYRYILAHDLDCFVGEAAWHFSEADGGYFIDILIHSRYRGRGYGSQALALLCRYAKEQGLDELRDSIALDNPSVALFLRQGFVELWRDEDRILVAKKL